MNKLFNKQNLKNKTIDIHTHSCGINFTNYYLNAFPYCANLSELLMNIKESRIDYAVTFPVPTNINTSNSPSIDKKIREIIQSYEIHPYQFENLRLLQEVKIFGEGRIIPFLCYSLFNKPDEQIDQLRILYENYSFYGIKINPSTDKSNILNLLNNTKFIDFISKNNLPLIIHSDFTLESSPNNILLLANELKNIRICVAHLGRFDKDFFKNIVHFENVYTDISPFSNLCNSLKNSHFTSNLHLNYNKKSQILDFLMSYIPEKILFGSDFPWLASGYLENNLNNSISNHYSKEVDYIRNQINNKEIFNKISSENSLNFLFGK